MFHSTITNDGFVEIIAFPFSFVHHLIWFRCVQDTYFFVDGVSKVWVCLNDGKSKRHWKIAEHWKASIGNREKKAHIKYKITSNSIRLIRNNGTPSADKVVWFSNQPHPSKWIKTTSVWIVVFKLKCFSHFIFFFVQFLIHCCYFYHRFSNVWSFFFWREQRKQKQCTI